MTAPFLVLAERSNLSPSDAREAIFAIGLTTCFLNPALLSGFALDDTDEIGDQLQLISGV
jgi:hypothetical protein